MENKFSSSKKSVLGTLFFMLFVSAVFAQHNFTFYPVQSQQLSGRLDCMEKADNYGRLPASLKGEVRSPVWFLGENSAGLYVDFKTKADTIVVRYKVKGALNMPHMPTIGVSGVDLYFNQPSKKDNWAWSYGNYQFKDTIKYTFANIGSDLQGTYRLYLPLYNTVEFLEIGVSKNEKLTFVEDRTKPIVIYGTSIAQGACASRPGMAWTNILSRDFSNEVINLAFSGNGRLEQPILDLMVAQNAAVYILDCIPNLALTSTRTADQLDSLLWNAVQFIRSKRPDVPIVLTEHSSAYTVGFMNKDKANEYIESTKVAEKAFAKMKKSGIKNIYFLGSQSIGLDINSTVDYAHPNDWGMMKIAKAYERLLRKILK